MNIDKFIKIVSESKSFSEVSKKLYGNNYCGNRQTIKNKINEHSINITHFDFKPSSIDFKNRFKITPINEILIENSTYINTNHLKLRLYNEGLKERKCEKCGQDENWNGEKMSLILDHINGINTDNRLQNLRIVCPNCNATLSTHGGKNAKMKSNVGRKTYYIKVGDEQNKIINIDKSILQRKVKRPSYEQLLSEIKELGYLGTGRKYGVSDNAIRKWIKFYEKHIPSQFSQVEWGTVYAQVAGSSPVGGAIVEVVLHGENKVSADNLKNTDGMWVKFPPTINAALCKLD